MDAVEMQGTEATSGTHAETAEATPAVFQEATMFQLKPAGWSQHGLM
jgi:hypothetical protein